MPCLPLSVTSDHAELNSEPLSLYWKSNGYTFIETQIYTPWFNYLLRDRVSLCSLSYLGTCFVDLGGFKITKHPPAFTAWAAGLKVGTTTFNAVFERHEMLHREI